MDTQAREELEYRGRAADIYGTPEGREGRPVMDPRVAEILEILGTIDPEENPLAAMGALMYQGTSGIAPAEMDTMRPLWGLISLLSDGPSVVHNPAYGPSRDGFVPRELYEESMGPIADWYAGDIYRPVNDFLGNMPLDSEGYFFGSIPPRGIGINEKYFNDPDWRFGDSETIRNHLTDELMERAMWTLAEQGEFPSERFNPRVLSTIRRIQRGEETSSGDLYEELARDWLENYSRENQDRYEGEFRRDSLIDGEALQDLLRSSR